MTNNPALSKYAGQRRAKREVPNPDPKNPHTKPYLAAVLSMATKLVCVGACYLDTILRYVKYSFLPADETETPI